MVRETAPWIPKLRKVREAQQSGGLSKRKGWPTPRAQESHKPHHTRRCEVFTLGHPSDSARSTAGECGICAVQPPFSSSRKMQVPERIHPYKVGHRQMKTYRQLPEVTCLCPDWYPMGSIATAVALPSDVGRRQDQTIETSRPPYVLTSGGLQASATDSPRGCPHTDFVPLHSPLCLQLCQQLLDAIFFFERGQALFHVIGSDFGLGLTVSLGVRDLALHAIEGTCA